jgi:hypothetical protein
MAVSALPCPLLFFVTGPEVRRYPLEKAFTAMKKLAYSSQKWTAVIEMRGAPWSIFPEKLR